MALGREAYDVPVTSQGQPNAVTRRALSVILNELPGIGRLSLANDMWRIKEGYMRAKVIHEGAGVSAQGERTFAIIFDKGDEVMTDLTGFIRDHNITAGRFTAIGAFRELTLGFFDWEQKQYQKIPIHQQVEVLSLVGDIALKEREPTLHAHVVVGKADGTAHGGHLLEGHVRPTLEVMLIESPNFLRRTHDEESGLALIDVGASG
jgi:uncharacterized protein